MVDRSHHFPPPNAADCVLCRDTGLQFRDDTYFVCMAPHTEGRRHELQAQANEANETLAALERKIKPR
jgi:hypothetical protein